MERISPETVLLSTSSVSVESGGPAFCQTYQKRSEKINTGIRKCSPPPKCFEVLFSSDTRTQCCLCYIIATVLILCKPSGRERNRHWRAKGKGVTDIFAQKGGGGRETDIGTRVTDSETRFLPAPLPPNAVSSSPLFRKLLLLKTLLELLSL